MTTDTCEEAVVVLVDVVVLEVEGVTVTITVLVCAVPSLDADDEGIPAITN